MSCPRRINAVLVIAALFIALFVGASHAQVFYMYPQAPPVPDDAPAIGAYLGIGEHDLIRLGGFGRFNVSPKMDFGLELALDEVSDWRIGIGADVKYDIVRTSSEVPFDFAVQGGLGFQSGANFSNFDIPFGGIISRDFSVDNGRRITPVGGVYLKIRHVSVDGGGSDTDLNAEVRLGGRLEVWDSGDAFLGVHLGDGFLFTIGFNARV